MRRVGYKLSDYCCCRKCIIPSRSTRGCDDGVRLFRAFLRVPGVLRGFERAAYLLL